MNIINFTSRKFSFLAATIVLVVSILFSVGCSRTAKPKLAESICLETSEGCTRIINQGTELPTSYSETYSNMEDNQDVFGITLYQGEDSKPESNRLLGSFDLPIKKGSMKQGEASLQITFIVDESKKLSIITKDIDSGKQDEFVVGVVN